MNLTFKAEQDRPDVAEQLSRAMRTVQHGPGFAASP